MESLCTQLLTTTHLINKLPTLVLGNLTLYKVLLGKKLDYSMLRVFRYRAITANPDRVREN